MLRTLYFLLLLFSLPFSSNAQLDNYDYQRGDEHILAKLTNIEKEKAAQIENEVNDIFINPTSEEDYFSLCYRIYKKHLTEEKYTTVKQILQAAEKALETRITSPEAQAEIDFFSIRIKEFQKNLLPSYLEIQNKITAQFSIEDMKVVDSIRIIFYEKISRKREKNNRRIKKMSGSKTVQERLKLGMQSMLLAEEKLKESEVLGRMLWPKGKLRKKAEYISEKYADLFAQYETDLQKLSSREIEEIFIPAAIKSAEALGEPQQDYKRYEKEYPVSLRQKVFLLLVRE